MATIQFVGMPQVTPHFVVKYGYVPKLDGKLDWFVQVNDRKGDVVSQTAVADRNAAQRLVADIVVLEVLDVRSFN